MSTGASDKTSNNSKKEEGVLEKIARVIDPPGKEVSDAEIMDPGTYIPNPGDQPAPAQEQRPKPDRSPGTS